MVKKKSVFSQKVENCFLEEEKNVNLWTVVNKLM